MPSNYLSILATTALLSAAAALAQPQTSEGSGAITTSPETSTRTGTDTTTGTTGIDADQSTTSGTATGTTGTMSTPASNPGGTTTGTATDPSTGTEGMHGTFQGTQDTTGTGTATGAPNSGSGTTSGGSTSSSAGTVDNDATTSADARATAATGTSQPQGQDALFLRKAAESDRLEIASAQAAIDNATRSDTKMAARMLLQDHQQSSQKLQQIATSKGWALPSAATAESDQARMTSTSGANFDDRFMADQIRMHRDAISLYRQQAASGSDPDLRQFARDQLPHLEHHLEMLQGSHTQK